MTTLRQGPIAGLIAGLISGSIIASLLFADAGPANDLHTVARWFALDSHDTGRFIGFLLLIVLGGIFGLLFGAIQGRRETTLGRSLALGLITGFVWWIVIVLLLGTVIHHIRLDFGGFLYYFVPLIVYGMLLGALYFQRAVPRPVVAR